MNKATLKKPYEIPRPMFSTMFYDIPGGSLVKIVLKLDHGTYIGTIYVNPIFTSKGTRIDLLNAQKIDNRTGEPLELPLNCITYFYNEHIHKVFVLQCGPPINYRFQETQMRTFVVRTADQFENMLNAIKVSEVQEVGVKIFGERSGRFLNPFWLVFFMKNTLVPIEINAVTQCGIDIWEKLKMTLFENEKIIKVFHNIRSEVDYFFHAGIYNNLKNTFDTQMGIYYMDLTTEIYSRCERGGLERGGPSETVPLSVALLRLLPTLTSQRESTVLHEFESMDEKDYGDTFSTSSPQPLTLKYMALSVKYLTHLMSLLRTKCEEAMREAMEMNIDLMKKSTIVESAEYCSNEAPAPPEVKDCIKIRAIEVIKARCPNMKIRLIKKSSNTNFF